MTQLDLNRVFDDLPLRWATFGRDSAWTPAVDVIEMEKEYLIKAELPEVDKDCVHVKVENGILTIEGERRLENEDKSKRYHRIERSYGKFLRNFGLPEDSDPSAIDAHFKDGLLTVHLQKNEAMAPRSIQVKVN